MISQVEAARLMAAHERAAKARDRAWLNSERGSYMGHDVEGCLQLAEVAFAELVSKLTEPEA